MFGVCYYPEHWPEDKWRSDAEKMAKLGLSYVRIGEFAWSRIEPRPQDYQFEWMDRAIAVLTEAGLAVVIGTPTATPPSWLVSQHPDILPEHPRTGRIRGFGSRRHYDFSSRIYHQESMRITKELAQRYGQHTGVIGWQTDNELCCHDTAISVSAEARRAFQLWCQNRYGDINSLNSAWGNVFWSMEYPSFEHIDCPYGAVTETSPAHQLAFQRFSSDQVCRYHDDMIATLRRYTTGQFITHNFIPMHETGVDNVALAKGLDFVSYDNYPLGRTDLIMTDRPSSELMPYMRTGHPDYATYYHDQTRGLLQRHFWVMEQQPGPVNWANSNPRPAPGMVRLWTLEAFAHGADCVSYFRWRQAPFAQEQMHAGLLRIDDSRSDTWHEIEQVIREVNRLKVCDHIKQRSRVAIISAAESHWVSDIERQSAFYDSDTVQRDYYCALRQLGLDIDLIAPSADLSDYDLVLVPSLPIADSDFIARCKTITATLIFGPRAGAKTHEFSVPNSLAPGVVQQLIPIRVTSVETLRADCSQHFQWQGRTYKSRIWREFLDTDNAHILASLDTGDPAVVQLGSVIYIGTLTCSDFLLDFLEYQCQQLNIPTERVPSDVRLCRRGPLNFAFNYSDRPQKLDLEDNINCLLGSPTIAPYDVTVWREL